MSQPSFELLINSFIADKVGIADNFLSKSLAANLKLNLQRLHHENLLVAAGTGNIQVDHDRKFRGDSIHWLGRENENIHENLFFDLMDEFVAYLNETCYTGINSYEFHYTLYPVGSFYKRHLDQFRNNDSRKFSMIMYLNQDWELQDGGELCIFHRNSSQNIAPENGKMVFFKSSELEHEVLLTNKPRMSITGWLKS